MKLHFYSRKAKEYRKRDCVSMPSRANAPFLLQMSTYLTAKQVKYQCPLGLMLHFYENEKSFKKYGVPIGINALSGWGFISTMDGTVDINRNGSVYQCPFGLRLPFYCFVVSSCTHYKA